HASPEPRQPSRQRHPARSSSRSPSDQPESYPPDPQTDAAEPTATRQHQDPQTEPGPAHTCRQPANATAPPPMPQPAENATPQPTQRAHGQSHQETGTWGPCPSTHWRATQQTQLPQRAPAQSQQQAGDRHGSSHHQKPHQSPPSRSCKRLTCDYAETADVLVLPDP